MKSENHWSRNFHEELRRNKKNYTEETKTGDEIHTQKQMTFINVTAQLTDLIEE